MYLPYKGAAKIDSTAPVRSKKLFKTVVLILLLKEISRISNVFAIKIR